MPGLDGVWTGRMRRSATSGWTVAMRVMLVLLLVLAPGAAWAEGWYLLAPPWPTPAWPDSYQSPSIAQLDASAKTTPLSRWDLLGSYDTAAECAGDHAGRIRQETEFSRRRMARVDELTKLSTLSPGQRAEFEELLVTDVVGARIGLARCISATDPSLAR
jgi:hypothetical protein